MFAPQLPTLLLLLGGAVATIIPSDEHFALLLSRQAPGTPKYECHSNCGSAITGGRVDGYCTDPTWLEEYNACLVCAQEFDIWKYYGSSVSAAAAACGLSTEAPSSPSSTSADTPVTATTTSGDAATTTASTTSDTPSNATPDTSSAEPTAGPSTTDVPATPSGSTPAAVTTTAPPPVGTGSNSTSSAPSASHTYVSVSGARGTEVTGSLLGVAAIVVFGMKALWYI